MNGLQLHDGDTIQFELRPKAPSTVKKTQSSRFRRTKKETFPKNLPHLLQKGASSMLGLSRFSKR